MSPRPSEGSSREGERLQKALAHAGIGSRRAVEELIAAGRVKVNGRKAILGARVDIHKDKVEVDGSLVPLGTDLAHYLLNKPAGVVTTADDPQGRPTVLEIVDVDTRVWPVGRLDAESEGALIITNDGELTMRLTHPRYGVGKTYLAHVRGSVGRGAIKALSTGVDLDDGVTRPARARLLEKSTDASLIEIEISEGRNRQVRRMCDAVGHPVLRLTRVAIGPLRLGRLKTGSWRKLTLDELRALYRACGM